MARASTPALAAACLVLLSGCGARGALDLPSGHSSGIPSGVPSGHSTSDVPAPPPPCSAWQPAGNPVTVSELAPAGADRYLMAMIPSADGALLGWLTLGDAPMSSWYTVALGVDAAPRGPIETHLSFPTGDGGGGISLASNGSGFAGLFGNSTIGCQFLPLDEDGMEVGPAVHVGYYPTCNHLAPTPDGFSFFTSDYTQTATFHLVRFDAKGTILSVTLLPPPAGAFENGWLALHDQSFLLGATDVDGVVTSVQRFSPSGMPLAAAAEIATEGLYEMPMVETSAGVLAAWGDVAGDPGSVYVRLLDENGSPAASASRVVEGGNDVFQGTFLAPTPSGDAILAWRGLAVETTLYAMALGPDGIPRGAPTSLGTFEGWGTPKVVVAPDGRRALLAIVTSQGAPGTRVLALPLACAP